MQREETDLLLFRVSSICFFILVAAAKIVFGDSLEADKQVLLQLKSFLEKENPVTENQRKYINWHPENSSPCGWPGISCDKSLNRVVGINLFNSNIAGKMFHNFSALTELSFLDLSGNTIGGSVPEDLGWCEKLKHLNLSHNIICGELNFTGLGTLEVLDISINRIHGDIRLTLPVDCKNLVVANISHNNITGEMKGIFENCWNLKFLDVSINHLEGDMWNGFHQIEEFSAWKNKFRGPLHSELFIHNCSLRVLDLSENEFFGEVPSEISNCKNLEELALWGNKFTGHIPKEMGLLPNLRALYLGKNNFSREIPESFLGLRNLMFLDLSGNCFGGEVQTIFGRFTHVKFLLLHKNEYIGGIHSSGILTLTNIVRLDLSYNEFSGALPVEVSQMRSLKYLVLAYNQFTGNIPSEYGKLTGLQALDLSFNKLTGLIPPSLGNLRSLLWLMLANNSLTGEIPQEIGSCSSLLWLNLANNRLSGTIPPQLTRIGMDATSTFVMNRQNDQMAAGSGECLTMMRWIPADYPPFSFQYKLLTRKSCRNLWNGIVKGYHLFPVCSPGSNIRRNQISGYAQLSGNQLSGEIPVDIGNMVNFSVLNLASNRFSGKLPNEIGNLALVVLNVSRNTFSGEIPWEIGKIKCLQNLDLSNNNFSGVLPLSISNLSDLNKFNISYNPNISGSVPVTGQLATFDIWSFVGNPLLHLPPFVYNSENQTSGTRIAGDQKVRGEGSFPVAYVLAFAFIVCGLMALVVFHVVKSKFKHPKNMSEESNSWLEESASSSISSSGSESDKVKIVHLDKTAFTHDDILKATKGFSDERIIGRGGSGTVYRGVLPDGREVAVKKLQSEGIEGEREFKAEMEVLTGNGNGNGWPHPNLVTLHGWCLNGSDKLLIYEYMEGGSLENLITDRVNLDWRHRLHVAVDVARALVFLHHECFPSILHRDVKASNVLLDRNRKARVTDFGLARVVDAGGTHVTTVVAGTIGYVAPEYSQTWQATTKGDVYSYGVLAMELATGRRAVDGGEECLIEWAKRVMRDDRKLFAPNGMIIPSIWDEAEGAEEMSELLGIGLRCTAENPNSRPNMKEVLAMVFKISCRPMDSVILDLCLGVM